MKKKISQPVSAIVFPRADPVALAAFDPRTKECTMNCGPHMDDPRSKEELKFLCDDCIPTIADVFTPAAKRVLTPLWIGVASIRRDNYRLRKENIKLKLQLAKLEGK